MTHFPKIPVHSNCRYTLSITYPQEALRLSVAILQLTRNRRVTPCSTHQHSYFSLNDPLSRKKSNSVGERIKLCNGEIEIRLVFPCAGSAFRSAVHIYIAATLRLLSLPIALYRALSSFSLPLSAHTHTHTLSTSCESRGGKRGSKVYCDPILCWLFRELFLGAAMKEREREIGYPFLGEESRRAAPDG